MNTRFSPVLVRLIFAAWSLALALHAPASRAHSHVDVQATPSGQLLLIGATSETMVYVPPGEPFSGYATVFPGGYYACELTFGSADPLDPNALPRIQLISVSGPPGASFAFWEAGATSPTWTRPAGWTTTAGDSPSFHTYEDGSGVGHIHGRLFTATQPGTYTVVFRAIDGSASAPRAPSEAYAVTLTVLAPPQLSLRITDGAALLSFSSRANLTYDLQVSTDLQTWRTVEGHDFIGGTGSLIELTDPLAGRPRVFYRLVEYF